ncbi:hypothetical protein HBI56_063440 [Parastagonospora nodorum]|nr:hypothetical protein HBI09_081400 [Parastagonospora nodorum]KAH4050188.1 hypothetical protein HBH49_129300 [Parastagonospora nodorum]KAH4183326.1 hypothetical protein HBH42_207770 [Parastagonospora nodorum]KAH4217991.1 hypothetical protein HBI06_207060 [Parastagonospora nodorum]KAH4242975.1 hypothetical protein HBI05_091840 [Parastagonospora nodorum]
MSGILIPLSERQSRPSQRNVSDPYNLAIPPRSQRRSTYQRADTPTQYLDPPDEVKEKRGTPYLEIPTATIVVTERPRPRTLNGSSQSMIFRHESKYDPKRWEKPRKKINDRVLAFAVTFGLAVLLAIAIPLAVILPQKYIKPLPINVLVPFFVDTVNDSWERLEDAIIKYHDIHFSVVVNPNDGPGNATWPSATMIESVQRINKFANVQVLGYIDTANGTMLNATVRTQIATYAGWSNVTEDFALDGIFFDRTPWKNDDEGKVQAYLRNVSATVRTADGWADGRKGLVVHNAGHIPDADLMDEKPDIVVMFEGAYDDMPEREALHAELAAAKGERESFAMLVNSVPKDLGRGGLRRIVESVRRDVEWLYLTNLTDNVYAGYSSFWEQWLDVSW